MVEKNRVALGDAIGRAAPWIVSALALAWIAPKLVTNAVATLHMARGEMSSEPAPSLLLGLLCLMCLAALSTCTVRSRTGRNSFGWALVPIATPVVGVLCVSAGYSPVVRDLVLDAHWWPATTALVLMTVVTADTLRRRDLSVHDLTARVIVACTVIWFSGVASSQLPVTQGLWPLSISASPACATAGAGMFRVVASVTAAGCVVAALASRVRRNRALELLPLGGFAAWFASRAVIDTWSYRIARGVCLEWMSSDIVSSWGARADLVGATGLLLCISALSISTLGRFMERSPTTRTYLFALVPTLWLLTSPILDSNTNTRPSDLVWQGTGSVPAYASRDENRLVGVLNSTGELHLFQSGQHTQPANLDVFPPPPGQHEGIAVLVQAGATAQDLRNATSVLRRFNAITLVWHANDLHRATQSSRDRWPFVQSESTVLHGREFRLRDPQRCSPYRHPRCDFEHASIVRMAGSRELAEWLRAPARILDDRSTLLVPTLGHEAPDWNAAEAAPTPSPRVVPANASAALFGLLLALFAVLAWIARELFVAERLAHKAVSIRKHSASAETRPSWVAPELATLVVPPRSGDPYRGNQGETQLATSETSLQELRKVAAEVVHRVSQTTMRWVFVAAVATALGFVLPLLF